MNKPTIHKSGDNFILREPGTRNSQTKTRAQLRAWVLAQWGFNFEENSMTEHEMEGFLRGKCLPRDIRVNESTAQYLVRKLAERDADKRRIEELEAANALNKHLELAILKAEGCSEALRRRAETAEQRIAELEARTLTVKLPRSFNKEVFGEGMYEVPNGNWMHRKDVTETLESACAAAGISLKIEGE